MPSSSCKCVRWYSKYTISYRHQEMRAERGVAVDHTTIWGWIQYYAPRLKQRLLEEVRETAPPVKRLNADIEAPLYRRMKTRAVQEDRTLSAITRQLWLEYLEKHSA